MWVVGSPVITVEGAWVWLLETEQVHPNCLILEWFFTQRTKLSVYKVMSVDSRRTLLSL